MLNRPIPTFHAGPSRSDAGWKTDEHPATRLTLLFLAMLLPVAAVSARLIYLQAVIADQFVTGFDQTRESFEPIPSPDGRILAGDGRVLAFDFVRYNVRMHYRWLEEPADPDWLRSEALARLTPQQRRVAGQIEAAEQAVLSRRQAAWDRLAELAGLSSDELEEQRRNVQRRVERIYHSVLERRREKLQQAELGAETSSAADGSEEFWQLAWRTVREALTSPPHRTPLSPLVITEQEDYHTVIQDVPHSVAVEVEAHPEFFPGTRVEMTTSRTYPERSLAAHVIGTRTVATAEDLKRRRQRYPEGDPLSYRVGDRMGRTGVERTYDPQLRGLPGRRRIVTNRRGEAVHTEIVREPRVGSDVVLTLDMPLQERAEALLDEALDPPATETESGGAVVPRGGCILALDVHTGTLLAAASAPRYDLQFVVDPEPDRWRELLDDPRRPFFPRMTRMTLPPGSVFKALSAVAILEAGVVDPREPIYCHGFLDTPDKHRCYIYRHYGVGHGELGLSDALCQSCNVYFFTAARRMGPEPIVAWARRFGFGAPTGIDLPGERAGNVPAPPAPGKPRGPGGPWYSGDTLGLAIGQSRLTVTPLQIVRMMATVANGGLLVTPHVVNHIGTIGMGGDAGSVEVPAPRRIPGLSPQTLAEVREGLSKVVSHPRGTGYKQVRLKQIAIAGKTGTAEVGGGQPDHAWFAGYVPAERPRIAFVVVLEHGGPGGSAAGPLARQLVEAMLETGVLEATQLTSSN